MSKELPYFKFYTGEWSNGDITLEDYETQGVFINVCAYYWFKECQLTVSSLKKKFRSHDHIICNLLDLNIIKSVGDNILISFLNEQFSSKEVQKAVNRNNGKLGGRPIGKKTENKPNGLFLESETKPKHNQYKEEKSIEEYIVSLDTIVGLVKPTPTDNISFSDRSKRFIDKFNEMKGSKFQVTDKVKEKLKARLKNYSSNQIIEAVSVALKDPMHIEQNLRYLTPDYILRSDIIERYLNFPKQQNSLTILSAPAVPINHQQFEEQH